MTYSLLEKCMILYFYFKVNNILKIEIIIRLLIFILRQHPSQSSHNLLTIFSQSSHNLLTIFSQSSHNILTIFTQSSHNLLTIFSQSSHILLTFFSHSPLPPHTLTQPNPDSHQHLFPTL